MRIVVTGASGFIGKQLVPLLKARGCDLLLVGRNREILDNLFPGIATSSYSDFSKMAHGFDCVLHLAVLNNNKVADWDSYVRVNADMPIEVCQKAKAAGIRTFVLISSTHALELNDKTSYAESKRLAVERLATVEGIGRWVLYLPAVVGDQLAGKLAVLNRFPTPLRRAALEVLKAFKPTVHVSQLADTLTNLEPLEGDGIRNMIVTAGQGENVVFSKAKRFVDLAFSLSIVALLWWAMIAIWVAIKLQSPGPGIFRQQRVGRNEEQFTCLKFRTMFASAPNVGTHEVPISSITPIGHFLRRTKLDELPQVINILRNEMSLVGPRPCLPNQTDMILERRSQGVFAIKPGITGLAQVRGIDMSNPAGLAQCDREYLQLQSLVLDTKLIVKTATGAGSGDKVRSSNVTP